uniref:tRNA (guanine(9)-N(1))-methyltransferase n=1 Tax=Palpitomonas bilix TaxID=652834 RepID=A0A7S3DJ15_9EUKA
MTAESAKDKAAHEAELARKLFEEGKISKNALKKKVRLARAVQAWTDKKARRKEENEKKEEKRKKKQNEFFSTLTKEEKDSWEEAMRARREKFRALQAAEKQEKEKLFKESKFHLVIDLGYETLMTDREVRSVAQQVMYSVSTNTVARPPYHLHISGLRESPNTLQRLKRISGYEKWLVRIRK